MSTNCLHDAAVEGNTAAIIAIIKASPELMMQRTEQGYHFSSFQHVPLRSPHYSHYYDLANHSHTPFHAAVIGKNLSAIKCFADLKSHRGGRQAVI
jgi:hypothetical protein